MKKCNNCNGTGKILNFEEGDRISDFIDREADKPYYVNYHMAIEKAKKEFPSDVIECPICSGNGKIEE